MGARFYAAAGTLLALTIIEYTGPASAASWQYFSSTNQPTVDYQGLSVPIGGNALIAAVEDEVYGGYYDLEVLGESSNSNGHHMDYMFPIVPYSYGDGPPEYVWSSSGKYYEGISASSNGAPEWFGWTDSGQLINGDITFSTWDLASQGVPVNVAMGMGTLLAPWQPYAVQWGPIFALMKPQAWGSPCAAASGYPHGTCICMAYVVQSTAPRSVPPELTVSEPPL